MSNSIIKKIIVALTLLLLSVNLFSQNTGTLNYSVAGLEQGDKSIVSFGSDAHLETRTITADGDYTFTNIPEGKYFIKIEAIGYNIPQALNVTVNEDGSVHPYVGIKLVITKMEEDSTE